MWKNIYALKSVHIIKHVRERHQVLFSPVSIYLLNLTIETLEQGVKYAQKLTIKTPERRLASLLLTLNMFHTLF